MWLNKYSLLQTSPKKIESADFILEDSDVNRSQKTSARRSLAFENVDKDIPAEKRCDCKRQNDQVIEPHIPAKRFKPE